MDKRVKRMRDLLESLSELVGLGGHLLGGRGHVRTQTLQGSGGMWERKGENDRQGSFFANLLRFRVKGIC